jgi:hypothetical protein
MCPPLRLAADQRVVLALFLGGYFRLTARSMGNASPRSRMSSVSRSRQDSKRHS